MKQIFSVFALTLAALAGLSTEQARSEEAPRVVNIYSAAQENLVRPVLDAFTKETGIKVQLTTIGEGGLIARLTLEGEDSPADTVITADVANLYALEHAKLLKPTQSSTLEANIPAVLRDANGHWFGFAQRARVLFVRKDDSDAIATLKNYEDLTDPKWKGSILVRSSQNEYNRSLMADMVYRHGAEKAKEWAKGLVANMTRSPEGGDRDQLRALASGVGRVAIANTYYFGIMSYGDDPKDREYAEKLQIIFPNRDAKDGFGTHLNIRGGGVTASATHTQEAVALLEFLSRPEAQRFFADANYEYPANQTVAASEKIAVWGFTPKPTVPLSEVGRHTLDAAKLMQQVGWN